MKNKIAFLTGITGQTGSYLAELLLDKGYTVHGIVRRSSSLNTSRIDHIWPKLNIHFGDLADGSSLARLIAKIQPDEVFNLGAQSHVRVSFDVPEFTADVTGLGTLRLLEAIRESGGERSVRFYQAGSSEMFGLVQETPQRETTPFYPRSPYGAAKVYAHWITVNYRESFGMYASNGLLFNHESPRRGETFVTRKVAKAVARIKYGLQSELFLGNLEARRDWGFSKEYAEGIWLMLQQDKPDDYVLATGETHSVREFVEAAFRRVGLNWQDYVRHDQKYERPAEVELLLGDASKAKRILGWEAKTKFADLVDLMVDAELKQYGEQHAD